ncbi:hypothetical protein A9Q84_13860 [Halobacteriovorax marinus]|uniref:Uncharacterized protein n=1 Tax=Halobacteriovorax marinus TaxID=97084 RepID=A0A1Y5F8Z8_9BACT|nr:hypothetical protein A9Q84_13860 [Halobacteriovorax marinus]
MIKTTSKKFRISNLSKNYGIDCAIVAISSEALFSIYGGVALFELGLYYLIPPLTFIPVSIFSTVPLYIFIKKFVFKNR